MRVQVEITASLKLAAEAQAEILGYPSLATLLRVVSANLAREYQATQKPTEQPEFKHWPKHIRRDLATVDPQLYQLYLQSGLIR